MVKKNYKNLYFKNLNFAKEKSDIILKLEGKFDLKASR